jgi:hypothetical protein
MDQMAASGKSRGRVYQQFHINNSWCTEAENILCSCSPDLEFLMLKCRPHYMPREFTCAIITAVYISPQANTEAALSELYNIISQKESSHPEAVFIVTGDFNKVCLKHVFLSVPTPSLQAATQEGATNTENSEALDRGKISAA